MTEKEKVISKILQLLGIERIDMNSFDNRLKYQKMIYLLQNFGLSLGFGYNWYVRGPYSPELAKSLFEIAKNQNTFEESRTLTFKNNEMVNRKIGEFREVLAEDINDPLFLEIIASLVFIEHSMGKSADCNKIKNSLLKQKPQLKNMENINAIIDRACEKINKFN